MFDALCEVPTFEPPSWLVALLDRERGTAADETVRRVIARAEILGMTRLTSLTGIDLIGIPNYAAICPTANFPPVPGMVSVFSGKGITKSAAKASAVMEAVERYSAIWRRDFCLLGSYASLRRMHQVLDPVLLGVKVENDNAEDLMLEWVPGVSLRRATSVLIPVTAVYAPYRPFESGVWIGPGTSTGLASGNTLEEAIIHALYEIIERYAIKTSCDRGTAISVDLDSIRQAGLGSLVAAVPGRLQLEVRCISSSIAVPVFEAVIRGFDPRMRQAVSVGQGAHRDPRIAVVRAITEASQSRVTTMAGLREDLPVRRAAATGQLEAFDKLEWLDVVEVRSLDQWSLPRSIAGDQGSVIAELIACLVDAGIDDAYMVDLTRPELKFPVVRVLVPGLFG